jgi:hypothetical protein
MLDLFLEARTAVSGNTPGKSMREEVKILRRRREQAKLEKKAIELTKRINKINDWKNQQRSTD